MKGVKVLKKVIIAGFLILVPILVSLCSAQRFTLYGRYLNDKNENLKGFKIKGGLQDEEHNHHIYKFKLKKDGSFKIRIKEKGIFIGYFSTIETIDYPPTKWTDFMMSNESTLYIINTLEYDSLGLKNLYISEELLIIQPKDSHVIALDDDYTFMWEKNELAEYYKLAFYTLDDNEESGYMAIHGVVGNTITLQGILSLYHNVDRSASYEEVLNLKTFRDGESELIPGEYYIDISAYIYAEDEKRFVFIAETKDERKPNFIIK